MKIYKSYLFVPFLFILLAFVSCSSSKKIRYFQDIPDSGQLKIIAKANYDEPKIRDDDILTVVVQMLDPTTSMSINAGNIINANTGAAIGLPNYNQTTATPGYLVDKAGYIDIPVLGKIKASGYTTSELKDIILKQASVYYKNPTVIVRYANFRVSVTGEVTRPGTYILPNERVSVLDAISLAGDLTIYGKRDNVLLLRENTDGTKTPYRINLKKSEILSAPYFYLHQNDVIYVEPGTSKAAATDAAQSRNYAIIGSVLSVLIVFISRH